MEKNKVLLLAVVGAIVVIAILAFLSIGSFNVNPVGEGLIKAQLVPASDVAGKDLSDVPRPQGFVRAEYNEDIDPNTGEVYAYTIVYRAKGDKFSEVTDFYKNELVKYSWEKLEENTQSGEYAVMLGNVQVTFLKNTELHYTKENGKKEVYVDITLGKVGNEYITQVEINYQIFEEGYAGTETEEYEPIQEEPYVPEIPRYNGAILYDREKAVLGPMQQYIDHYYIKDGNFDDIVTFYENLNLEGFVRAGEVVNDGATITFSSENGTQYIIAISKESGGVKIDVSKVVVPNQT